MKKNRPSSMLTAHFSREEFTRSQIAERNGLDNTPSEAQWRVLSALCEHVLEPARRVFGPIGVSSGFRCTALNTALHNGRVTNSDHQVIHDDAAADIVHADLGDLFRWVYVQLPWSRLIWEYGRWVHVSYSLSGRPHGRLPQLKVKGRDYEPLGFDDITRLGR